MNDDGIYIDERILQYIADLMKASASTVDPSLVAAAAKAQAEKEKRRYVIPMDVKAVARDVLRVDESVVREALDLTPVP